MAAPGRLLMAVRLALAALLALLLLIDPLDAGAYGTTNLKKKKSRSQATKRGADPDYDEHGIKRGETTGNRGEASDHQRDLLPDRADPRVKRELQCSICVATVHEVAMALPRRKDRRPKEWELAEAMEDICLTLETYGDADPSPLFYSHLGAFFLRRFCWVCWQGWRWSTTCRRRVTLMQERLGGTRATGSRSML